MSKLSRVALLFLGSQVLVPLPSHAQPAPSPTDEQRHQNEQRIQALRQEMQRSMQDFEARIDKLEAEMNGPPSPKKHAAAKPRAATQSAVDVPPSGRDDNNRNQEATTQPATMPPPASPSPPAREGSVFEPGKGIVLLRGDDGEVSVSLVTYFRYLNQLGLDHTYTDSFGRTKEIDLRQDFQWNKVNLSFKGWLLDPSFEYRVWIWTQNPAMGQGAQVIVGGHLGYHFTDWFSIYGGVAPVPTDRTTNWTYPLWLKMDNRTIADEFFRGSYSFGVWADGDIAPGLKYRAMVADNLSILGVSADQLDADPTTLAATIWWMPTTGEYGPGEGYGDYEYHEDLATRFGVHFTRSREDRQSQPSVNDFENVQIRLSDGTQIFGADPFGTGGIIEKATYRMMAANAGFKYEGWSLEGEYYIRWVDEFKTVGFIPVDSLYDTGFGVQASTMIVRDELQLYAAGSEVFGQYGDPWDFTIGINWYPLARREGHINVEAIYLSRSPVGGLSYPYPVGGDGWLVNTDFIVSF